MSAAHTATIDTLERQIGKRTRRVTPGMVDAFATLVRGRLHGEDPALRNAYVALFVSEVAVDQRQIRISDRPGCWNALSAKPNRPSWA